MGQWVHITDWMATINGKSPSNNQLVGGLVAIFYFPYIGSNHPNWLIFFRGVQTTNQPIITMIFYGPSKIDHVDLETIWNYSCVALNDFEWDISDSSISATRMLVQGCVKVAQPMGRSSNWTTPRLAWQWEIPPLLAEAIRCRWWDRRSSTNGRFSIAMFTSRYVSMFRASSRHQKQGPKAAGFIFHWPLWLRKFLRLWRKQGSRQGGVP